MTTTNITQTTIDRGILYEGGFKWASDTITYSVPGFSLPGSHEPIYYVAGYDAPLNEPLSSVFGNLSETLGQIYNFAAAMEIWDSYVAPSFNFLQDTTKDGVTGSVGDIRIAFSEESPAAGKGFTPPPPNTPASPTSGDIWLDDSLKGSSLAQGTYNFQVVLHEAGHALGLQHTFPDSNQLASYVTGQNGENYNLWTYSVMSYNSADQRKTVFVPGINPDGSAGGPGSAGASFNPVVDLTPMVLDIQAIQDLYGKDLATGSGNDTYAYTDADFDGRRSLYDAGGTDTLDFSKLTRGSTIDLRPGAYSDIDYFSLNAQVEAGVVIAGEGQRGFVQSVIYNSTPTYQWTNNFAIAFSTVIENVIGTAKADTIIGNTAANVITGGAGADTISGGGGKDIFRDTAANLNGDTITDFINSNVIHVTDATGALQKLAYAGGTLSFALPGAPDTTYAMAVNGATGAVQQKADALGGVDIYFGTGTLPAPTYSVAVGATTVNEGSNYNGNSLTYTVTRTSADSAASVDVVFTGTAQSVARYGLDFTTSGLDGGNRLAFAAGALTATFTITTFGDATQEANESIIATIANATDGTIGTASVKVNILDDDGPGGVKGKVVDGYVVGATVFADTNGNGVLDPGEASAVTDSQGSFALAGAAGPLVATGGTDSSTGLPVTFVMAAPDGATVITPLTTIAQALAVSGAPDPVGATLAAFGLPASFDLTHTNPLDAIESGVSGAVTAVRGGTMVADTLLLIAAGLEGAGVSVSSANASAISAIASYVASHGAVDLTHADVVTAIASSTGLSQAVASTIGIVASASNTVIGAYTNFEDEDLGAVQRGAQQDVASAIMAAGSDPTKLASLASTYGLHAVDQGLFGTIVHDATTPAGALFELYDGLLGRAPDPLGFESYIDLVSHGATLSQAAGSILGSAEYQAAHGVAASQTAQAFVDGLYGTVLHRVPDGSGETFWIDALSHGSSRADLALAFATSSEHVQTTAATLSTGVFAPDPTASGVARLYDAILGRAPDSAGLQFWVGYEKSGHSDVDVAAGMLASSEYTVGQGGLADPAFLASVYQGALGRAPDAGGLQHWEQALASGSRASVAAAIAESPEAMQHHLADIETGWHIA